VILIHMKGAVAVAAAAALASLAASSAAAPGAGGGGIDLRLMIQRPAPGSAELGSNVHLTVRLRNYGPEDAWSPTLRVRLPPNVRFRYADVVPVSTGGSCLGKSTLRCSFGRIDGCPHDACETPPVELQLDLRAVKPGSGVVRFRISGRAAERRPSDNHGSVRLRVGRRHASADLTALVDGPTIEAGAPVLLGVHLVNGGPSVADEVTAVIRLVSGGRILGIDTDSPLVRCEGTDTDATTVTCTLRYLRVQGVVDVGVQGVFAPGDARLEVKVASATRDPRAANNRIVFARSVAQPERTAAIGVRAETPGTVAVGERAPYTARITNFGPESAADVHVGFAVYLAREDSYVEGTIVSTTTSQGACSEGDCSLGTLAAGSTVTVTLVAMLPEPGTFRFGAYAAGDRRIYDPGRYDFDSTGHPNLDEQPVVAAL